jgi:hypothetical protein
MPQLRQLVKSSYLGGLDLTSDLSVHVRFVVNKVDLREIFF